MYNSIIVDNFFETPTLVREFALKQKYNKPSERSVFPGERSQPLSEIDWKFANHFQSRIVSLLYNIQHEPVEYQFQSFFQWIPEKYEEGWVHFDDKQANIAGVVYLTPDAPNECGTSVYSRIYNDPMQNNFEMRDRFYADEEVDIEEYREMRSAHNKQFEKTIEIGNKFNRLFLYNSRDYHRESKFFGKTKEDSRLTLVFFARIVGLNSDIKEPFVRSKLISTY